MNSWKPIAIRGGLIRGLKCVKDKANMSSETFFGFVGEEIYKPSATTVLRVYLNIFNELTSIWFHYSIAKNPVITLPIHQATFFTANTTQPKRPEII